MTSTRTDQGLLYGSRRVVTRWPKEHSGPIFYRCQFEHEEGELPLTYERMLKAVVYNKFGERYKEVDTLW